MKLQGVYFTRKNLKLNFIIIAVLVLESKALYYTTTVGNPQKKIKRVNI